MQTKPSLSDTPATLVSTRNLTGITEYDPSEYTFTALAGTPVSTIKKALAEKGQYLPCDPLLGNAGATLGGAIASGLSGPDRFRYGGLRDFLLGIQFIGGSGSLHRSGGKVVKNSAGFDLPKFFVGSLGRFGILTEVTFKVFPSPPGSLTLKVPCTSPEEATRIIIHSASSRWELEALDYHPSHSALYLKIAGPLTAVKSLAKEIQTTLPGTSIHEPDIWNSLLELTLFNNSKSVVKVPVTPKLITPLESALKHLPETTACYSVGGNLTLIGTSDLHALSRTLAELNLQGMTIQSPAGSPLWPGKTTSTAIYSALKSTLDPDNRFPSL